MYQFTEIFLIAFCLIIIIFGIKGVFIQNKYKKDSETVNRIIEFFEKEGKEGVEPNSIPKDIIKTGYINFMLKDKTLIFKNKKYYLNKK